MSSAGAETPAGRRSRYNAALRRLGYSTEEQTGHGFRTMASTLLNEQGFPPDVLEELQLLKTFYEGLNPEPGDVWRRVATK